MQEADELIYGRYVHTEFTLTDPFLKFVNDDVLPRVHADGRYVRAVKIDSHEFFLVHDRTAEENPQDCVIPLITTLKGLLSLMEVDDPDEFSVLKFGIVSERHHLPMTSEPDPYAGVRAVSSNTGFNKERTD
ncbi:MAG TPA: hypothetical protein VLG25_02940 [Patescibacteria group bacterium]|nr:hypothetical protein [Patescibacteria group bacterium]